MGFAMDLQSLSVPLIRGRSWKDKGLHYVAETETFSGDDDAREQANNVVRKIILDALHAAYYGHLWHVHVDTRPEVMLARIRHPLAPHNAGITLALSKMDAYATQAVKMAGQLLERYRVPRGAMDVDAFQSAKQMFRWHRGIPE
jgi:hypothetical protein